jgi:hypothetical protein
MDSSNFSFQPFSRKDFDRLPVGSHVGAAPAAGLADKSTLDIGKSYLIVPSIGVKLDQMTATIISAIDQDSAQADCSHFSEGDFGWTGVCRHPL